MKASGHWRAATVADICEMRNGHGFGPGDWSTEGLPIIRIQNLNGGKKFDYFAGQPDSRWLVQPGQLLFAWAGTKGVSFGPTIWHGPVGVLNQHIFQISPKDGIDQDWLYWALRHVTDRVEGSAHGFKASLVHVKKSDIDRQPVLVPDTVEQHRIARILSTWDQAIVAAEQLLANCRKHRILLGYQMLTGRRRLGRCSSDHPTKVTQHGRLPSDWDYRAIGEVAEEVSQKLGDNEAYPVLSCTKHDGLVDSLSYFKKQVFSADVTTYKVVPKHAFVYATNHIDEGSIGYQSLYDFGLVSPMYTVFRTHGIICNAYLYALLKTEHYRQIFASAINASVDRRGSLRWKDFRKLRIPVPPLAEQQAIADVIAGASREAELLQQQLHSLRKEKAALMAQLLTGKRRVHLNQEGVPAP